MPLIQDGEIGAMGLTLLTFIFADGDQLLTQNAVFS